MSTLFASALNRLNRAVVTRLSTGEVITVGGSVVDAIFDNGNTLGNVGIMGMASTQPVLNLASADVPSNPVGAAVLVGSASYLVAAHEPDGTGISRLLLESAT
ncbi:MAG: hypothetical protein RIR09_2976 [Pseudomonadota bacterium]|jgi:hypothetical protein